MAKRKVIVYKDPYGKGGYINKTAKWLNKAQMGAESGVSPVTAGIMQQMQSMQPQQQQQQQVNFEDIIVKDIVEMISRGGGSEDVKEAVYAKYAPYEESYPELSRILPNLNQLVEGVFAHLGEEAREQQNERLEITEETTVENPEQEEEPDDNSASYYNELAESDNDANYMDYTNNNSRSSIVNDMEFNALDDDEDVEETQSQQYIQPQQEGVEADYGSADDVRNNWAYKQTGGAVPNKRSFVNKMVRQLKKAQDGQQTPASGTETKDANTANVKGTENNPTQPVSTTTNNTFVGAIRNQAQDNYYRQQAEQMYRNMYMNQRPGLFGGGRMARANRRMFGVPFTPPGVTSAKYNFGLFGGLRNADIQFNPLILMSMFPSMSFPGMYGVNQSGKVVTPGRLVTETIAQEVNNKSTEEVAKATGSEAAAKAADKSNTPSATTTSGKTTGTTKGLGISTKTAPSNKSRWPQLTPSSITQFNSPVTPVITPTPKPVPKSTGKVDMSGITTVTPKVTPKPALIPPPKFPDKGGLGFWDEMRKYADMGDFQVGGFVDPNRPDLTKFVYGNEVDNMFLSDILQPPVNQSDLDYTDSKDVTDPYFRDGGLYRFDGTGNSEVDKSNTFKPITTKEEYDKAIAEEKKKIEEATQKKYNTQTQTQQQQYYPGGFGSAGPWQPVWGYPQFGGNPYAGSFGGRGMFQTAANLYRPFTRGASTFSPVGDPLQYAATAAAITKAGMLPTGTKYSKERKQDGNWFERNLGFNKDRITTIDYATPGQIAAGLPALSGIAAGTTGQQDNRGYKYKGMGLTGLRLGANDLIQRIKYGKPLEDDRPYTQQSTTPASNFRVESPYTPVSSMTSTQGADVVTGTPGTPVNINSNSALNTTPGTAPSRPTAGTPKTIQQIKDDAYENKKLSSNDITSLEKEYGDLGPDSDIVAESFENYDEFKKFMDSGPTQSQLDDKIRQGYKVRNRRIGEFYGEDDRGYKIYKDDLDYFDKETQDVINQTRMQFNPMGLGASPREVPAMPSVGVPTTPAAVQAQQTAAAAQNITPQRTANIYDNPTTSRKGNFTVINAAGEPVNIEDADYYDEEEMVAPQQNNSVDNNVDAYETESFSPNPYDRSMQPFNPDYEQPTEYEFGVNPTTGSGPNDMFTSEANPLYAEYNPDVDFNDEEEIFQTKPASNKPTAKPTAKSAAPVKKKDSWKYGNYGSKIAENYNNPKYINKLASTFKMEWNMNIPQEIVKKGDAEIARWYKQNNYYNNIERANQARNNALWKIQNNPNLTTKKREEAESGLWSLYYTTAKNIENEFNKKASWKTTSRIYDASGKPAYQKYGGIPRADLGINFSPVSYPANSIVQPGGIGQGKIGPCTEAEVKDPNSPCYDPMYAGQGPRVMEEPLDQAQLRLKENRTGTINYDNISRGLMDAGATLADIKDYRNERLNRYIPQMTDLARGERSLAYQDYNPGGYDPRTGRDVYQQGFEGVIGKKGGSIKNKKTKAPTGGHKIDISDFQNLIKLAGLNKK
jgi:hypothetical protein